MKKSVFILGFLLVFSVLIIGSVSAETFALNQYPGFPSGDDDLGFILLTDGPTNSLNYRQHIEAYGEELYMSFDDAIYRFDKSTSTWNNANPVVKAGVGVLSGKTGRISDFMIVNNKIYFAFVYFENVEVYEHNILTDETSQIATHTYSRVEGWQFDAAEIAYFEGNIYVGNYIEGVFRIDGSSFTSIPGLSSGGTLGMEVYKNKLYIAFNEFDSGLLKVYEYDGSTFNEIHSIIMYVLDFTKVYIDVADNLLYILGGDWDRSSSLERLESYSYDGTTKTKLDSPEEYGILTSASSYNGKLYFGASKYENMGSGQSNVFTSLLEKDGASWRSIVDRDFETSGNGPGEFEAHAEHSLVDGVSYEGLMHFGNDMSASFIYNGCRTSASGSCDAGSSGFPDSLPNPGTIPSGTLSTLTPHICSDPDQEIFSLSREGNAHIYPAGHENGVIDICYDEIFADFDLGNLQQFVGGTPSVCDGGNEVIGISESSGNAHAASLVSGAYGSLCYGDLECEMIPTDTGAERSGCGFDSVPVLELSGATNAHVGVVGSGYANTLCCLSRSLTDPVLQWEYWNVDTNTWDRINSDADNIFRFSVDLTKVRMVINSPSDIGKDVVFVIREDDLLADGEIREDRDEFPMKEVGPDGKVNFEWTITTQDLTEVSARFLDEENELTDVFEFYASINIVGGLSFGKTSIGSRLYAQQITDVSETISCSTNKQLVSRKFNNEDGSIDTTFWSTIASEAAADSRPESQELAARGCEFASNLNKDDPSNAYCCPSGWICGNGNTVHDNNFGCYVHEAENCEDLTVTECVEEPLATQIALRDKYRDTLNCDKPGVSCNCEVRANECELVAHKADPGCSGTEASCYVRTVNPGNGEDECIEGTKKLTYQKVHEPGTCGDTFEDGCSEEPQSVTVACGKPAFELPFFGMWQIIGSILGISILYLVMFQNIRLRKFIYE